MEVLPVCLAPVSTTTGRVFAERCSRGSTARVIHICIIYDIIAYFAILLHEHLPAPVKRELKQVGWTKGLELAKVARRKDGQEFDYATWLHKAREMPKEEFRREVEKELTGRDTEPSEIVYFKLYKSQIPVVEQAIETAALMLGTDKSRGYCLEMICADFLAGANLDGGDPELLLQGGSRPIT